MALFKIAFKNQQLEISVNVLGINVQDLSIGSAFLKI